MAHDRQRGIGFAGFRPYLARLREFKHTELYDLAGNAFSTAVLYAVITATVLTVPLERAIPMADMKVTDELEEVASSGEAEGEGGDNCTECEESDFEDCEVSVCLSDTE